MTSILQRLVSNVHVARLTSLNSICESAAKADSLRKLVPAASRSFHSSSSLSWLIKEAELHVVDDSEIGMGSFQGTKLCLYVSLSVSSREKKNWIVHLVLIFITPPKSGRQAKAMDRPPRIIGIHGQHTRKGRFRYAQTGDRVSVAVRGQVKWGYVVGCRNLQRPLIPKFDSNNVVLVEKNGTPCGKRVLAPVPSMLRKKADGHFSKVLAICTKFYWVVVIGFSFVSL